MSAKVWSERSIERAREAQKGQEKLDLRGEGRVWVRRIRVRVASCCVRQQNLVRRRAWPHRYPIGRSAPLGVRSRVRSRVGNRVSRVRNRVGNRVWNRVRSRVMLGMALGASLG